MQFTGKKPEIFLPYGGLAAKARRTVEFFSGFFFAFAA
jgi:hypothetical protein